MSSVCLLCIGEGEGRRKVACRLILQAEQLGPFCFIRQKRQKRKEKWEQSQRSKHQRNTSKKTATRNCQCLLAASKKNKPKVACNKWTWQPWSLWIPLAFLAKTRPTLSLIGSPDFPAPDFLMHSLTTNYQTSFMICLFVFASWSYRTSTCIM